MVNSKPALTAARSGTAGSVETKKMHIDKIITGKPEEHRERIKHGLEVLTWYANATSQGDYFRSAAESIIARNFTPRPAEDVRKDPLAAVAEGLSARDKK